MREIARRLRAEPGVPVIFFRVEEHGLAYHLGHPLGTVLEWETVDVWAHRPFPVYVVMRADCAGEWARHLGDARLDEVLRSADWFGERYSHPFVVFRSRGERSGRP
jgi:hypothetical protein